MSPTRTRALPALAAVAAVAVPLAGCGASASGSSASSTPSAASAPAQTAATRGSVRVKATEFAFAPKAINAKAGRLKVTLANAGHIEHELVLLRTKRAPDALPVKKGRASEAASVGEISETKAGKAASHTFRLKRGHYVMICNLPGHYKGGMRGEITVR